MATSFSDLSVAARTFVAITIALGLAVIGESVHDALQRPLITDWLFLAGLTLLTGSFSIKLPGVNARISVSEAFVIAAVILFGPSIGTIIVTLDTLVVTSWTRGRSRAPVRALFNMSSGAISLWTSAHLYHLLVPTFPSGPPLERLAVPVALLAVTYFAINSFLVAVAIGFETSQQAVNVWRRNFAWLSLNYLGGASIAMLLVTYTRRVDLTTLSVIVPLLVIVYLTFRTSLARLDDAHRHVAQINDLYLSTIETLAMAVDAKDQITHGHIRRVQVYAIELAKRLGVTDAKQLKAIEVAALLHDMGKLAIPEHILNKPGRLSSAEFDKMKRHADIGADLLSAIKFPYPVVPIVRHHHEHWDGTGYPAGIAATDIPLGARILSVVDCFDALTSDRPYRPRLSVTAALDVIRQRRGTLYDPMVVDAFLEAYPLIAPAANRAGEEARSILSDTGAWDITREDNAFSMISASGSGSAILMRCIQEIGRATGLQDSIDLACHHLRSLTPATVFALYRYDAAKNALLCHHASGNQHHLVLGLAIDMGERISGWSAAHRQSVVNSDAGLDLQHLVSVFVPPLRSAIAVPMLFGERVIGVFSAYSPEACCFTENHRYYIEQVATALAVKLHHTEVLTHHVISFPGAKVTPN